MGFITSATCPNGFAEGKDRQVNKPLYMYLMKCNLIWELSIASKRNLTSISDRIPKALHPTDFFLIFVFCRNISRLYFVINNRKMHKR